MASLIPDFGNIRPDTAGAMNNYLKAMENTREAFAAPVDLIDKIVDRNEARKRIEEERRRWEIENRRAQTLADRQTEEFEREKTLRGVRKDVASEFTSSPYAAKWGADKVTSELDKLVNQEAERRLAAGEAPFSAEEASQLQAYYESARPYKEDAVNSIAARLVAQGEDAVKAKQEAEVLASGTLLSKADQQARLDAQQKMYQDFYGSQAKANLDAAKLNQDYDIARMKMYGGAGSGGSGGGGSGFAGTTMLKPQETIEKWDIGPLDSKEAMGLVNTASTMGYTPWQIQKALENSINLGVGEVISDKKVVEDKFKENLLKMSPGQMPGSTGGGYSASNFMPQFAPRQIAGYDPEGFARDALRQMPWLDRSRPAESSKDTSGGGTGYKATVANTEAPNYTAVNKTSGAMGQYQFLNSTLNDYRDKFGGFTNEQFLNNPKLQDQVFDAYTKDNEAFLKSKGVEVTDWTRWLAHNLGIANVKPFLEGRMTEGVEKAIKANLPGQTPSIDNYIDKYAKRFNAQDLVATTAPENVNPETSTEKSRNYAKAQELMTPSERSEFMKLVDAGNVEGVNKYTKEILDRDPGDTKKAESSMKTSAEIKSEMDVLNKKGITTPEMEAKFRELDTKYAKAKQAELKKEKDTAYSRSLFDILGIDNRTKEQRYKKASLGPDEDASLTEKGLEDVTLETIPAFGAFAKAKALKPSGYDDVIREIIHSPNISKSGLKIDEALVREIFNNSSPLAKVKSTAPFAKNAPDQIKNLIDRATKLRNIENPTLSELEELAAIQKLLKNR